MTIVSIIVVVIHQSGVDLAGMTMLVVISPAAAFMGA